MFMFNCLFFSGALKNVYALAAGAVEGIGFGANTTALLVTRATVEMHLLATALGRFGNSLIVFHFCH